MTYFTQKMRDDGDEERLRTPEPEESDGPASPVTPGTQRKSLGHRGLVRNNTSTRFMDGGRRGSVGGPAGSSEEGETEGRGGARMSVRASVSAGGPRASTRASVAGVAAKRLSVVK